MSEHWPNPLTSGAEVSYSIFATTPAQHARTYASLTVIGVKIAASHTHSLD